MTFDRRSNPLPSPNATPKRRKSVQSKVKLLSQHARPAEATSDGTPNASSSADSTQLAEQLSASSNADNATPEAVKVEPTVKTEGQKTESGAPSAVQLSIPVSAVVTSRAGVVDGTTAVSVPPGKLHHKILKKIDS